MDKNKLIMQLSILRNSILVLKNDLLYYKNVKLLKLPEVGTSNIVPTSRELVIGMLLSYSDEELTKFLDQLHVHPITSNSSIFIRDSSNWISMRYPSIGLVFDIGTTKFILEDLLKLNDLNELPWMERVQFNSDIDTTPIEFKDLSKYNDSNSIIFMGVVFNEDQDWNQVQDFLVNELQLIPKDKHLIGAHHISDNIRGSEGRSDYLFEFDNPNIQFDILARLKVGNDIKWTSDFIDNCASDYKTGTPIEKDPCIDKYLASLENNLAELNIDEEFDEFIRDIDGTNQNDWDDKLWQSYNKFASKIFEPNNDLYSNSIEWRSFMDEVSHMNLTEFLDKYNIFPSTKVNKFIRYCDKIGL